MAHLKVTLKKLKIHFPLAISIASAAPRSTRLQRHSGTPEAQDTLWVFSSGFLNSFDLNEPNELVRDLEQSTRESSDVGPATPGLCPLI